MRIGCVVLARFPTERAHGLQTAKVADALLELGHSVAIVAPGTYTTITASAAEYYRISPDVRCLRLEHVDPWKLRFLPEWFKFRLGNALFLRALRAHVSHTSYDLFYVRSPLLVSAVADHAPTILELHSLPDPRDRTFLERCRRCTLIVCLTTPMRDELVNRGIESRRVIVAHDGYDPDDFANIDSSFRSSLGLPPNVPVIGYAGQLRSMNMSKGVEVLLDAAAVLYERACDFRLLIAGGPQEDRLRLESALPEGVRAKVMFLGQLDRSKIPSMLSACDMLVYPAPSSQHPFYRRDTSPLKVFEYLASGTPMICADLPPLRDVVDSSIAQMVPPGDSAAIADAVMFAKDHLPQMREKALSGQTKVRSFAWTERMKTILEEASKQR